MAGPSIIRSVEDNNLMLRGEIFLPWVLIPAADETKELNQSWQWKETTAYSQQICLILSACELCMDVKEKVFFFFVLFYGFEFCALCM